MTAVPSPLPPANAQWFWVALMDANFNAISTLPVSISSSSLQKMTADAVAGSNVPEQGIGLWNGATVDRLRSTGVGATGINVGIPLGSTYIFNGANFDALASPYSSGVSNATNGFAGFSPYGFNNSTFDAWRNNLDVGAIITASAVTTTQTSSNQFNLNGKGCIITLNVTNAGTGNITLHIQGLDSGGSSFYDVLVGAAVGANGLTVYQLYPGMVAVANSVANAMLPRTWRVQVVANNANAITYTVAAVTIV